MNLVTHLVSSGVKIFHDWNGEGKGFDSAKAFKNEPFSFQLAYKAEEYLMSVYHEIDGNFPMDAISVFTVGNVPVMNRNFNTLDDCYEDRGAGLYPDMLIRRNTVNNIVNDGFWAPRHFEDGEKTMLFALTDAWQSLWITLNENSTVPAGDYEITVRLKSQGDNAILSENVFKIHIMDAELPKQTAYYTNWFHYDCLSDTYNIPIFSERFYEILEGYLKNASMHGMNTLLLPSFTPELDTPVGKERMTAQLVKVTVENGEYSFDFTDLKYFMNFAIKCGMTCFEHTPLFTQWGAKYAPKIMAYVNGEEKQIFGWDTLSMSDEYITFLKAYLTALRVFLEQESFTDKIFFHVSDEPTKPEMVQIYKNVYATLKDTLNGLPVKDTFTKYDLFKETGVDVPIVCVCDIDSFIDKCDEYWFYYTGESVHSNYTNRLITNLNTRCRVLGVQMYYYNAKGFLHWAYNYYYGVLSHGLFDPAKNPCGYEMQSGTSYLVYPETDGTCIPSIREKLMMEALCDLRALLYLEEKLDGDAVKKLCDDWFGGVTMTMSREQTNSIVAFRQKINELVEA